MFINEIKINPKSNQIPFKQEQTPVGNAVLQPQKDTVELKNKPEPPQISNSAALIPAASLTDEQIEQVNKAGRLPDNLKFSSMSNYSLRGGNYDSPIFYVIQPDLYYMFHSQANKNSSKEIPEGYVVVKKSKSWEYPHAIKIKENKN